MSGQDVIGEPLPASQEAPQQTHEWRVVEAIQDRETGQIGVVQVCSCGEQARTVPAPWVES